MIVEDPSPLVPVYDPAHPDANAEGYVMMPNVNTTQEMIDLLGASRAYEANVTAFNATKAMAVMTLGDRQVSRGTAGKRLCRKQFKL